TDVHYLALVCDDQALAERLQRRPEWRGSGAPGYIEEHQRFNQWFKSYDSAHPPIRLLDTTDLDEETTANKVELWINEKLRNTSDTIRFN
ncbi:MAG TPA: nucleoside kinase, partial [Blastocatellia bacterium]